MPHESDIEYLDNSNISVERILRDGKLRGIYLNKRGWMFLNRILFYWLLIFDVKMPVKGHHMRKKQSLFQKKYSMKRRFHKVLSRNYFTKDAKTIIFEYQVKNLDKLVFGSCKSKFTGK